MAVNAEQYRVLRVIQQDREVEELVRFQVPYTHILLHLRCLLAEGLIQACDDGKVRITELGQRAIAEPPAKQASTAPITDGLEGARTQMQDQNLVYLPANDIE